MHHQWVMRRAAQHTEPIWRRLFAARRKKFSARALKPVRRPVAALTQFPTIGNKLAPAARLFSVCIAFWTRTGKRGNHAF
jgi:hypothetical protein